MFTDVAAKSFLKYTIYRYASLILARNIHKKFYFTANDISSINSFRITSSLQTSQAHAFPQRQKEYRARDINPESHAYQTHRPAL